MEMMITAHDLKNEYLLRGKLLLPPNTAGNIFIIPHPTDPDAVTHTFDTLKYLRNPPTYKDGLYLHPDFGFYKATQFE